MKKDRNCGGAPYPTYQPMMPGYGPQQPMGPVMMPGYGPQQPIMAQPMPGTNVGMAQFPNSNLEQQVGTLTNQVNSLERRVAALESLVGNPSSSKYNTSNYQMM